MLVTILQITIPIKFSHTIPTSDTAQMIKSCFEVYIFVFESLKSEMKIILPVFSLPSL